MKISTANPARALTLIEVLVVVVVVAVLLVMLYPVSPHTKARPQRIACVNNLKQIGLGFHLWASDHGDKYPMLVSTNAGGTMEFVNGSNAFLHFRAMSNELNTPKILFCPAESDSARAQATIFLTGSHVESKWQIPFTGNSNVSYFIGVDAVKTNAEMFLSGDHNITNGAAIKNGLRELTTNLPSGWTDEIHQKQGNVGMSDGSVQAFSRSALRDALQHTGLQTNRLAMP